jgi:DNA-binding NarL/FixJ family response regulator
MNPITVLLAEDHTVVRAGLRALLASETDIQVIGEAENGREAVTLTNKLRPNVVVMDIAMPLLNGLEATRQILKLAPETKVLILSAHSDDEYVEQTIAWGAAGYLVKQSSAHLLPKAIRDVHSGKTVFSPSVAKRLVDRGDKRQAKDLPQVRNGGMSSREVEVLQLIAEGLANKQVASELAISIKTVEKHRQNLMRKLGIHDTAGLTRYAISAGIIEAAVKLTIE